MSKSSTNKETDNNSAQTNTDIVQKEEYEVVAEEISLGVNNGSVPTDFYSANPCTIGYSYIRFEVDGKIRPCCISKYEIAHLDDGDWRNSWHSNAWTTFRKKLTRIHIEKFHLTDTNWLFCQQCSHIDINRRNIDLLSRKK